jgi:hypothetical protein
MHTTAHPVLRRALVLTARRAAALVVGALVATIATPALGVLEYAGAGHPGPSRAERLTARYDCWTHEAPAGAVPGHAVVRLPGEVARRVPAEIGFGIWLDHDPGVVYAFCR